MCFCQLKGYFRSALSCNFLSESYWCAIIANYKSLLLRRGAILAVSPFFPPRLKAIHYFFCQSLEILHSREKVSVPDRLSTMTDTQWKCEWLADTAEVLSAMSAALWQRTQYCPGHSTGQHHNMGCRQGVMCYLHNLSPILQSLPRAMTEGLWGSPMRPVA